MRFPSTRRSIIALFGLAAAVALGCGGGGDDGLTGTQDVNVTGTWDAIVTVTGGTQLPEGTEFGAVLVITQSGTTATGTSVAEGGFVGQLSGTISGRSLEFTITQGDPCPGSFSGTATVNGSNTRMSGSYSGSDCNGSLQATLVATKR